MDDMRQSRLLFLEGIGV